MDSSLRTHLDESLFLSFTAPPPSHSGFLPANGGSLHDPIRYGLLEVLATGALHMLEPYNYRVLFDAPWEVKVITLSVSLSLSLSLSSPLLRFFIIIISAPPSLPSSLHHFLSLPLKFLGFFLPPPGIICTRQFLTLPL